jgi:hypothetical protein
MTRDGITLLAMGSPIVYIGDPLLAEDAPHNQYPFKPYQSIILSSSCRHHRVLMFSCMIKNTDHLFSFSNQGALCT